MYRQHAPQGVSNLYRAAVEKTVHRVVVVVQRNADLLEMALALRPSGGLARLLHGWKQQRNQDAEDGDHRQQLDQCKTAA